MLIRRLLLVGGAAGTGKTTVARALAVRLDASWLQLDTLWATMRDSAPAGSSRRRLLDIDDRIRDRREPLEALLQHHLAASRAVCDALPEAVARELSLHPSVVADGAWLLPEFVRGLVLPEVEVTALFLHEPDLDQLERGMSRRRNAVVPAPWHADSTRLAWTYGNWLAEQARAAGLPVLDARPYETAVDRVTVLVDSRPDPDPAGQDRRSAPPEPPLA